MAVSALNDARAAMDAALKTIVISELRNLGWRGSLPHLRRITPDRVDYLMVQQRSGGGSFVIELVSSGPDGLTEGHAKDLPVEKLKVSHFKPFDRLRLGSDPQRNVNDNWYVYAERRPDGEALLADPGKLAHRVLADYRVQAEAFLSNATVPPPTQEPRPII